MHWSIQSLLYPARRNNELIYKGLGGLFKPHIIEVFALCKDRYFNILYLDVVRLFIF